MDRGDLHVAALEGALGERLEQVRVAREARLRRRVLRAQAARGEEVLERAALADEARLELARAMARLRLLNASRYAARG